jgi:hypothetical protein
MAKDLLMLRTVGLDDGILVVGACYTLPDLLALELLADGSAMPAPDGADSLGDGRPLRQ